MAKFGIRYYSKERYYRRMLTYEELKANARKFLSLTSLTPDEFADLLPVFERAYGKRYAPSKTLAGKSRGQKAGAGRKGSSESIEQKLLFILVYQKSYPLQSLMGELFGISQGRANPMDSSTASNFETSFR